MKHGQMPSGGGQPKGREFREIATDLQAIAGGVEPPQAGSAPPVVNVTKQEEPQPAELPIEDQPNELLSKSDNETRRSLAELDKQLIVDPADMSPAASRYIRSRPWATPEFLREARCGYMPSAAKSTLRGQWVFGVFDEQGEPLCWVGRNLKYEEQMAKLPAWRRSSRKDSAL